MLQLNTDLFFAIQEQAESDHPDVSESDRASLAKDRTDRRKLMFARSDDQDEFKKSIAIAVAGIEEFLRPHLQR